MSDKAGFLGLGTAGGVAAGAVTVTALIGVLYATGVLAPAEDPLDEPAVATTETSTVAEPATEAPSTAEAEQEPATETPTTAAPEPADDAPGVETVEEPAAVDTETVVAEEPATTEPEPAAAPDPAEDTPAVETAEDAATEEAQTAPSTETAEPAVEPALSAPRFDVVRAAPDGTTVIAGSAAPGSTVDVLVDGDVADTQTVSNQGEFASLLTLPPSAQARILTLRSTLGARQAFSAEEIILAPTSAPQVAAVEPDATSEPAPTVTVEDEPEPETEVVATATTEPVSEPAATVTAEPVATPQAQTEATDADDTTSEVAAVEPTTPQTTEDTAPAAVAVLRADSEGVELVQPATSEPDIAPDQITLDTIGYSPEGDVLLSGRAQSDTLIRVYLDNQARADVTARADGVWRARLEGIEPAVYALRLDALAEDGTVLSRIETPFKRESPEALASAQPEADTANEPAPISQVTVQAGDTLWAISRERYGDGLLYVRVFEANRDAIRDPDLIYPGQIFTIPE